MSFSVPFFGGFVARAWKLHKKEKSFGYFTGKARCFFVKFESRPILWQPPGILLSLSNFEMFAHFFSASWRESIRVSTDMKRCLSVQSPPSSHFISIQLSGLAIRDSVDPRCRQGVFSPIFFVPTNIISLSAFDSCPINPFLGSLQSFANNFFFALASVSSIFLNFDRSVGGPSLAYEVTWAFLSILTLGCRNDSAKLLAKVQSQ